MLSGSFLLVDKPVGPTSHDVIDTVRQVFGTRRAGHSGTLDPFASGLLLVFLGKGTRLIRFLEPLTKTYIGIIRLGVSTDTFDSTGKETSRAGVPPSIDEKRVRGAFAALTGRIEQIPPSYSAKKVAGVAAYKRTRRGETVSLPPVTITIHRLQITGFDGTDVAFEAEVSSGTYIRAVARDVGQALATGAHLRELRRIAIGPFVVENATAPNRLSKTAALPLAQSLRHIADYVIDDSELAEVLHGRPLPLLERTVATGNPVALVHSGQLVAVAEAGDHLLQPRVVVAE